MQDSYRFSPAPLIVEVIEQIWMRRWGRAVEIYSTKLSNGSLAARTAVCAAANGKAAMIDGCDLFWPAHHR